MAKSGAEQHIGVFDQTVQQLGRQERRTATEVEAITAQISQVFSGDANLFQSSMAKVHTQLWDLWVEFGPDEEYYRVTGEERPRIIKKAEVAKKYDIFPAGTPANTNKALALARAREALQMFAADQTGLNKHALYKNYFDLLDRNSAKVVVRSEEEAAAMQQIVQAASSIAATVFNPFIGFQTVMVALIGGAATLWGPLIAAIVFSLLAETLRLQLPQLYMMTLGLLLILSVLYLPGGLASLRRETFTMWRDDVRGWWRELRRDKTKKVAA